jgi:hypothetical protein
MLVREHPNAPWRIEFGDWLPEIVADERQEYLLPDGMYSPRDVKIIITDGQQDSIETAVNWLNAPNQN